MAYTCEAETKKGKPCRREARYRVVSKGIWVCSVHLRPYKSQQHEWIEKRSSMSFADTTAKTVVFVEP